jgi:Flp pilus assembly secretin CpaC
MRHRKKLIAAALLVLVGSYATICFWPHSNPEAVRALAALREMVDRYETPEGVPAVDGVARDDVQVVIECEIAGINMTDATAGLFAQPGKVDDTRIVRRTKNTTPFLGTLRDMGVATLTTSPRFTTLSGQTAHCTHGGQVPITTSTPAGTVVTYRTVGTTLGMTARVAAEGGIILDFEFEQAQLGKIRSVATDQGQMAIPEIHKVSAHARAELKPGETLIVGGLSQKRPEKSVFKLPVLGELPGVGSWFQFTREREIEEELTLLATPRILNANAAPPAPVASAPGR